MERLLEGDGVEEEYRGRQCVGEGGGSLRRICMGRR